MLFFPTDVNKAPVAATDSFTAANSYRAAFHPACAKATAPGDAAGPTAAVIASLGRGIQQAGAIPASGRHGPPQPTARSGAPADEGRQLWPPQRSDEGIPGAWFD